MSDDILDPGLPQDAPYSPSDPVQVRERRRSAAMRAKARREFVGRMLADPAGRDWLNLLLESCHIWEQRFGVSPAGHEQQSATFFHAGQREIGLQLLRDLMREHPTLTSTMISEHNA